MTGREVKAQVLEALNACCDVNVSAILRRDPGAIQRADNALDATDSSLEALAPCVVLTREEATFIRRWAAAHVLQENDYGEWERIFDLLAPEDVAG